MVLIYTPCHRNILVRKSLIIINSLTYTIVPINYNFVNFTLNLNIKKQIHIIIFDMIPHSYEKRHLYNRCHIYVVEYIVLYLWAKFH